MSYVVASCRPFCLHLPPPSPSPPPSVLHCRELYSLLIKLNSALETLDDLDLQERFNLTEDAVPLHSSRRTSDTLARYCRLKLVPLFL
jgi:hypothetical protein